MGGNDDERDERRLRFFKYGFFVDLKKEDDSFEAVKFWNNYDKNVCEVFIYEKEVLQGNAQAIKKILKEKNNGKDPNDGWYVNIDVIYSGGNPKSVEDIIEEIKAEGLFNGEYKIACCKIWKMQNTLHHLVLGIMAIAKMDWQSWKK